MMTVLAPFLSYDFCFQPHPVPVPAADDSAGNVALVSGEPTLLQDRLWFPSAPAGPRSGQAAHPS